MTTSVRVELTISRLTVLRLNQLGHEVIFWGWKIYNVFDGGDHGGKKPLLSHTQYQSLYIHLHTQ